MNNQNIDVKENTIQEEIDKLTLGYLQKIDKTNDIECFEEVIRFINEKYEHIEKFDDIAYSLSLILVKYGCDTYDNVNTLLEIIFMLTIKINHKFTSNCYTDTTGGMIILAYIHLQIAEGRNGTWAYLPGNNKLLKHMIHVYGRRVFPDNPAIKGDETDEDIIEYINEINMARERHRNFWIFYPRLTKCERDEMDDLIVNDANFIYNKIEEIYKNVNSNNNNNNNNNNEDEDDDPNDIELETFIEELCSILHEYGSEIIIYKGEELINKYFDLLKTLLTKPLISLEAKNNIAKALKSRINAFKNPSFEKVLKSTRLEKFRDMVKKFH